MLAKKKEYKKIFARVFLKRAVMQKGFSADIPLYLGHNTREGQL